MSSQTNDRLLWLGIGRGLRVSVAQNTVLNLAGVTLFFAARGIAAELHRVKSLLEIKNIEKEEDLIGEATEDGELTLLPEALPSRSDYYFFCSSEVGDVKETLRDPQLRASCRVSPQN